jgi:hypothetical protein
MMSPAQITAMFLLGQSIGSTSNLAVRFALERLPNEGTGANRLGDDEKGNSSSRSADATGQDALKTPPAGKSLATN